MQKYKKRRKRKKLIVQWHHIDYETDFKVPLFKGEHFLITRLDRKFRLSRSKPFSKGFLFALHSLYQKYWDKAVDVMDFFKEKT